MKMYLKILKKNILLLSKISLLVLFEFKLKISVPNNLLSHFIEAEKEIYKYFASSRHDVEQGKN